MKNGENKGIFLGEQLEYVIGRNLGKRQWDFIELTRQWPALAGEKVAAHTKPAWIKKDVLWVFVEGSTWMQELSFLKPNLLAKVNKRLQTIFLSDMRWLQQLQIHDTFLVATSQPPEKILDKQQEENFFTLTQIVTDSGCQQALFRLWQTFQRNRRP